MLMLSCLLLWLFVLEQFVGCFNLALTSRLAKLGLAL